MDTGEFALVAALRRRFPLVGDDAAVVAPPAGPLLLAADAIVEGVDFVTGSYAAADVGWRAVLVNASDIAAMGGRPLHVLVSVCAPAGVDLTGLIDGVAEGVEAHGCSVAGGDLSSTSGPLVVSVAITGTVDDGGSAVLRSGARPGDRVFVTGALGAVAAAGYAVGRRTARVAEGTAARRAGATAMIDISDGFAADLAHLADDSGVGVVVDHVPVADGATEAQALGGGEDYELLFTLPADAPPPDGSIQVGVVTDDPSQRPPAVAGWQHRFS